MQLSTKNDPQNYPLRVFLYSFKRHDVFFTLQMNAWALIFIIWRGTIKDFHYSWYLKILSTLHEPVDEYNCKQARPILHWIANWKLMINWSALGQWQWSNFLSYIIKRETYFQTTARTANSTETTFCKLISNERSPF